MSDFWDKVEACDHEWGNHDGWESCGTPYCDGAYETRCVKCGVYKTDCACHFCSGQSGWPAARWRKRYERKRYVGKQH